MPKRPADEDCSCPDKRVEKKKARTGSKPASKQPKERKSRSKNRSPPKSKRTKSPKSRKQPKGTEKCKNKKKKKTSCSGCLIPDGSNDKPSPDSKPPKEEAGNNSENKEKEPAAPPEENVEKILYLVRHGEDGDEIGEDDVHREILTNLGKNQATATGKLLLSWANPYEIVSSALPRAIQTKEIILNTWAPISPCLAGDPVPQLPDDPLLNEGMARKDKGRFDSAFEKYVKPARGPKNYVAHQVIVCHANLMSYFVTKVLHAPIASWMNMNIGHGEIVIIKISADGLKTVKFGCNHLPPDAQTE